MNMDRAVTLAVFRSVPSLSSQPSVHSQPALTLTQAALHSEHFLHTTVTESYRSHGGRVGVLYTHTQFCIPSRCLIPVTLAGVSQWLPASRRHRCPERSVSMGMGGGGGGGRGGLVVREGLGCSAGCLGPCTEPNLDVDIDGQAAVTPPPPLPTPDPQSNTHL